MDAVSRYESEEATDPTEPFGSVDPRNCCKSAESEFVAFLSSDIDATWLTTSRAKSGVLCWWVCSGGERRAKRGHCSESGVFVGTGSCATRPSSIVAWESSLMQPSAPRRLPRPLRSRVPLNGLSMELAQRLPSSSHSNGRLPWTPPPLPRSSRLINPSKAPSSIMA